MSGLPQCLVYGDAQLVYLVCKTVHKGIGIIDPRVEIVTGSLAGKWQN